VTKLSKKPTYLGCKQGPTLSHVRTEPWVCRRCGKQACARCVKHFWKSLGGHTEPEASGGWRFVGQRVATCATCSHELAQTKKTIRSNVLLAKPPRVVHRLIDTRGFRRLFGRAPRDSDYEGVHTTGSRLIAGAYAMSSWHDPRSYPRGYPVIVTLDVSGLKPLPDVDALLFGAQAVADLLPQYRERAAAGETFYAMLNDDDFSEAEVQVGDDPAAFIFEDVGTHVLNAIDGERDPEAVFREFLKTGALPDSVLTRLVDQQRYLDDFDLDRVVRVEALRPWWHEVLHADDEMIPAIERSGYTVFTIDDWPFTAVGPTKTVWQAPDAEAREDVEYHGTTSIVISLAFPGLIPEKSPFPIEQDE